MAKSASRSSPKRGSLFAGVVIGLVFGALLAAAVALWSSSLNPFKTAAPAKNEAAEAAVAPAPAPVVPEVPPDLDFYRALPSGEALPPANEPRPQVSRYFLQAGAFAQADEADNLRASLALLGVEAEIQTETLTEGALHRVRIGPFTAMDTLNRTRALLEKNQISTVLVRTAPNKEETP